MDRRAPSWPESFAVQLSGHEGAQEEPGPKKESSSLPSRARDDGVIVKRSTWGQNGEKRDAYSWVGGGQ